MYDNEIDAGNSIETNHECNQYRQVLLDSAVGCLEGMTGTASSVPVAVLVGDR
jgi:hypothetical protein